MRTFLTSTFLLPFLVAHAFSYTSVNSITQQAADEAEYAVYAAVVERLFAGNKVTFDTQSPVNLLVIRDRTLDESHAILASENGRWEYRINQMSPISRDTAAGYRAQIKESRPLTDSFDVKIRHVLVGDRELARILKERRWEEFYEKYPDSGGFISFSRAGFNRRMTQALVYIEHWCGGECGSGIYLLLEKGEEGWKVMKLYRAWIS